jgi:hypothetical protein
MKALAKLFTEFIAWRWAPAVALLAASMVYVLVVVGVVPSEIGIPVANAKFSARSLPKPASTATHEEGATAYATAANDTPASSPPAPPTRHGSADFGRRGFSPRLDRPEPPPPPAAPPPPVIPPPVPTNPGAISNIFSRIQGALRPGAAAAAAAAASAQQLAAQPPAEQAAPAVPAAEPGAANAAAEAPAPPGDPLAPPGAPPAAPAPPPND